MTASRTEADVFQLHGEFVVRTRCRDCEAEIHSPCGWSCPDCGELVDNPGECPACGAELVAQEPSDVGVRLAQASRRTCEECLARIAKAERDRLRRRKIHGLIVASRMPDALRELKFADMIRDGGRRDVAIETCEKWAYGESPRRGVFLTGPAGVGKTRLAATAAWVRLERERPVRWVSIAQLMGNLRRAFKDSQRREATELLLGLEPLVLDDFDKVNPSDFGREQLFTAIDSRVQANVPLLVTANLRLDQVAERFGHPIASRLAGHCTQLVLDGADRRLAAALPVRV